MLNVIMILGIMLSVYFALRPELVAQRYTAQWRRIFGQRVAEPDAFTIGLYRLVGIMSVMMLFIFLIFHNFSQG